MFKAAAACLLSFTSMLLAQPPWDVEPEEREALAAQIEAGHQERSRQAFWKGYLIDSERRALNKEASACPFCQNEDPGKPLRLALERAGFEKMGEQNQAVGHCYGITSLFIKHLLSNPPKASESCSTILDGLMQYPDFLKEAHALSVNQPAYYIKVFAESLSHVRKELSHTIAWLKSSSMKEFLEITLGRSPEDYYFLTPKESAEIENQFSPTAIYTLLKKLPNKLLFLNYKEKSGLGHCLCIYNHPEKLLVFNSNGGLLQFYDLETLSVIYTEHLEHCQLSWIASFPIQ